MNEALQIFAALGIVSVTFLSIVGLIALING